MSFIGTRAAAFSVLLGFPLIHAFACSSPVRDYDAALGGGGGAKAQGGTGAGGLRNQGGTLGGAGDTGEGGLPSTGGDAGAGGVLGMGGIDGGAGMNDGGVPGTGGIPGAGGAITNTGGALVGSGGAVVGAGGNVLGAGGSIVGAGGMVANCVPTGPEVCTDGKDNDCNGNIDCLTPTGSFPEPHGAAAGKDVLITVNAPAVTGFTFQCRSARGVAVPDQTPWTACSSGSNTRIVPRTVAESQDPASNGLWTTQVRAAFPGGGASDFISLSYYMHSSMHGAPRCTLRATDQAFFAAGAATVADGGVFGTTTVTRAPFIQLGFTPTVSTYFSVAAGQGTTKIMSLRHRFFRRSDDRYILMTRNYASSRSGSCDAIDLRTHDTAFLPINHNRFFYDACDAVVFNKLGAGVCLYVDSQGVVQRRTTHVNSYVRGTGYSPAADNFFWRKLLDKQAASDGLIHFMPKCTTPGCERTGNNIYLPDRDKFPYF
ncbi:MAG: hypothetical protein ACOY0T_38875 [Myxococcota bacterium]